MMSGPRWPAFRSQTGLKDHFREAIRIFGMFTPGIAQIFDERGVPASIARLPFVESMYNYRAPERFFEEGRLVGMCCNFQKTARKRFVESAGLRLMPPPRTACG